MQFFHIQRLVRKYSTPFQVTGESGGRYVAGDWVAEKRQTEHTGAVLPITARRRYESGGLLTSLDRQLITLKPLDEVGERQTITLDGADYTAEPDGDFSAPAGVWVYLLKAVVR